MNSVRVFAGNRRQFCISLLGLVALASGCGDTPSTPPTPAQLGGKTPGEAERDARRKAFAITGGPKSTKASPKTTKEAPNTTKEAPQTP